MSVERSGEYSGFRRPIDLEQFGQPALHWKMAEAMTDIALEYREEPVRLRGGSMSNWFIDTKKMLMHPFYDPLIARMMTARMIAYGLKPDGIIGMGIGGAALARSVSWSVDMAVSEASNADSDDRYPRGIWGRSAAGVSFTLLDDALTSGSSIHETAEIIFEAGGTLQQIGVVTDRSEGKVLQSLYERYRVPTWSLFSFIESKGVIEPSRLAW